tara:strand:- start:7487 stop:7717 length:231 start_codon:yes stop_codon:yes gene_type:complete
MLTNPEVIAAVFAGTATILGAFFGFTKWMIAKFFNELKPNGGSSIKDKVEVNSERLDRVEQRVDQIYELLVNRRTK